MAHALSENEDLLFALKSSCDAVGIDLKKVTSQLGLPPKLLDSAERFVPSHLFNVLLETIATEYHCQDFALTLASKIHAPQLGLCARLMSLCIDLRQGLSISRQFAVFYHDTDYWRDEVKDGEVVLFKPASDFSSHHYRQRNLLGTAQMFLLLKQLSGDLWQPSALSFSFPDPGAGFTAAYRRFFNGELRFGQDRDAIHFSEEYLDYNLVTSDPSLLRGLLAQVEGLKHQLLDSHDFLDRARLLIEQRLRFASCSEADLAHFMNMPLAALRAGFAGVNSEFTRFFEQLMIKKASYYIEALHAPKDMALSALMPGAESHLDDLLTTGQ